MKRIKLRTGLPLMENIVRLADYRSRRKPARRAVREVIPAAGTQYFCTRCDSGEFRLHSCGMVHCAHCGAMMRNLLIGVTDPGTGAA